MTDTVENLILDLLEWLSRKERTYQETMEAWRTSCPRLPVWEDAQDRGLTETISAKGHSLVRVTPAGAALLEEKRLNGSTPRPTPSEENSAMPQHRRS